MSQTVLTNTGDEIEAILLHSLRPNVESAWHGHVAFAHWIVSIMKPRRIVELGTHNGTSFAAFCNAVRHFDLDCKCFAVDTWQGDEQAGFYSENVFANLERFCGDNFSEFAVLLRRRFDEALRDFEDGTVDLLHIDGLHTYEAVSLDFATWLPKMSRRGIVLFHDTAVTYGDFGVYKLWRELEQLYPSFTFYHSAGLGVLAVGVEIQESMSRLSSMAGEDVNGVRNRFQMASEAAYATGLRKIAAGVPKFSGENIAKNCQATQSSYAYTNSPTPQGAINGLKTGGCGFHTANEETPWWKVDFGSIKAFDTIVVYNRLDPGCEHRSASIRILLSDDDIAWRETYRHSSVPFGGIDGNPLVVGGRDKARYLRLELRERNYLHLDEVEVYCL